MFVAKDPIMKVQIKNSFYMYNHANQIRNYEIQTNNMSKSHFGMKMNFQFIYVLRKFVKGNQLHEQQQQNKVLGLAFISYNQSTANSTQFDSLSISEGITKNSKLNTTMYYLVSSSFKVGHSHIQPGLYCEL